MKIIFPEIGNNPVAREAIESFPDIDFLPATSLSEAAKQLASGAADSMLSGLDYPSRDVLIAYKNHLPLQSNFFSSCFICQKDNTVFALADGGVNKLPTKEQLYTTVKDTAITFSTYTGETPRIAMLSYSTHGSGGKNPDLEKIHFVIAKIRQNYPDWLIDGEMQLDAAVNPKVAAKKTPESPVAGQANILIVPDLNSGNILYKSLEQFAGFTCAGPIIQGFDIPLADLSRGSTIEDTILTIEVLKNQLKRRSL
jgi:phosphotransacetylase